MYLGKIVEMGGKNEIFSNPMHPYTQALMSSIPVPNPERRREAIELRGEVSSAIDIPKGCRFNPRCPYADKKCKAAEPELIPVKPNHLVSCYQTKA
jgi:oligopeptide/dipeptide ABC transporter ATP-binding protein